MKKNLTEFYVHNTIIVFLYSYEKRRYGYGTLQEILRELSPLPKGGTSNPAVWSEWESCVNESLKETIKKEPFGEAAYRTYTKFQAFNAMVDFLIHYYKRTLSGNLRILIKAIYSLSKNTTSPILQSNWNNAAKKALQKQATKKPEDETMEKKLTKLQAFNAMVKFLDEYYKKTASDFMDGLISSLYSTIDGGTANPTFWSKWNDAIKKILHKQNNKKYIDEILGISVTESQAFKAMVQFFKNYYEQRLEPGITIFFDYLHLLPNGNSASLTIREQWKTCVDSALKEKPGIREYLILGGDDRPGHLVKTPENEKLVYDVANDPKCYLGPDKRGHHWYRKILKNGKQVWTEVRNNKIINWGVNELGDIKICNSETGLAALKASSQKIPKPLSKI